jgi:hypothetical protein
MNLKSTCSLVATLGVAVALAAPASAALIVTPFNGGPFDPANPFGTFTPLLMSSGNTYDFTFAIGGTGSHVLTQLQASSFSGSAAMEFSLYEGAPGSGVLLGDSAMMTGPSLGDVLGAGSYYLQVVDNFGMLLPVARVGLLGRDGAGLPQSRRFAPDSLGPDSVPEFISGGILAATVPEPGSWGLMLLGLAGLGGAMRLTRPKAAAVAKAG